MITTTIRIDEALYEKVCKLALKEKRSINSQIQIIIEQYMEMIKWNNKK